MPDDPPIGRAAESRSVGTAVAVTRNIRTAEGESITQRVVATQPQAKPPATGAAAGGGGGAPPREKTPIATVQPPPQVQRIIQNVQQLRQASTQLVNAVRSGNPQEVAQHAQVISNAARQVVEHAQQLASTQPQQVQQLIQRAQQLRQASERLVNAAMSGSVHEVPQHVNAVAEASRQLTEHAASLAAPPQVQRVIQHVQQIRETSEHLTNAVRSGDTQGVVQHANAIRENTMRLAEVAHQLPQHVQSTVQQLREVSERLVNAVNSGNLHEVQQHVNTIRGVNEQLAEHAISLAMPHVAAPTPVRETGPPHVTAPIATVQPPPQVQRIIQNVQQLRQVSEQLITAIKSGNPQEVTRAIQQVSGAPPEVRVTMPIVYTPPREVTAPIEHVTQPTPPAATQPTQPRIVQLPPTATPPVTHETAPVTAPTTHEVTPTTPAAGGAVTPPTPTVAVTGLTGGGVRHVTAPVATPGGVTGGAVGGPPRMTPPITVIRLPRGMLEEWANSPAVREQIQNLERLASELAKRDPKLASELNNALTNLRSALSRGDAVALTQAVARINGIIRQVTASQAETAYVQLPNGQVVEMPVNAANVFTSLNREQQYDAMRIYYNLTMEGVNPNTAWMEAVEQARHWTGGATTGGGGGGGAAVQWVSYRIPGTDVTVNVPSSLLSRFESLSPAKQYMIYSTLSATHQLNNYNAWVNALNWGQVMSEKSAEQAAVASIAAKGGDKAVEQFKSALAESKAAKSDPSSPTITITVTGTATGTTPQFTVPPNLQQQFNQLVQQFMSQGMSQLDAEVAAAKALGIQVTYPTVTVTGAVTLANPNAIDNGLYSQLTSLVNQFLKYASMGGSEGYHKSQDIAKEFMSQYDQAFEKAIQLAKQGNYDQAYIILNTLNQVINYMAQITYQAMPLVGLTNGVPTSASMPIGGAGLAVLRDTVNARNQVFNYINGQGFNSFMSWLNKQLADAVQSGNATQAAALINAATQALNDLKQSDPSLYQSINGDKLLSQLQSSGSQAVALATVNAYISSYTHAPDALSKEAIASGLIQFLNDLKAKDPTTFSAINGEQLLTQAQQGFAGAVYSYVNTVLKSASGNVAAAENAANSGSYESALNHVDSAAYYYNTARSILEALSKDPTITAPNVKAAVAQGIQGINNALAQLQQLKTNIQVNQYYTTVLQPLLSQYNAAAKSGDPVAIYNAASALVNAINTLSQSNPQLYKAVNQLVQESTGMTLGNIASFLQQKVLNNQYLKTINDAVANLQAQLAANPQLANQLGLPFGVSPRTSQMTSEVAKGIVLSVLSTIVPIVSNLYAVYMANTYRGPNGQLQLIPGAAQTVAQAFDQAWNALAGYAGWLNSIGLGNLVIGTDPSGKPITLSQFINNLREERRNLDAYVAANNIVSWFNSVVNGYVENPQGTILSAGVAQLNQYIQQFNQTGDPKYLQQAQQYAQQLLNVLNMGGVNRQAIQNAINAVQQSNIDNKQQVLQGLQAMLQFYDNLSQIATQGLLTQQQAYAQQYMFNLIQNLNGASTNLNDPETQQFLASLNKLNIPNINKQLIYQYFTSMKVGDYLAGKAAEWLSTLPEPLRMALGFTYGMGEWINKLGLTLASIASQPATSLVSAFGGLALYPLGLGIQMLSPRTTPNPVLQAATWAMNLPWQVQGAIMSPERQMSEISKAFALTTPSITLPDSWLLRDALGALGVDYNVAKVGKTSVIKLDPVSFGTLASSMLFLVFPVVGDITSGVGRLTETLADPGGFLASLQRIGAPDAVISGVSKLLNWAAGSPEAQASLYNIARSLYSVSDAVRNLDFFTPIFDEVAPYAARALGKLWDALGKVSPNLQQMAINAANRVLQTAPNVAYPSSFVNIGLRWLIGSDIGFFIGSQIGRAIPFTMGPEWSSYYNEWMKQWLFGIIGSLIGGGVAAFGAPGLIREVYALTGDPATGDLLASAFEKADNLGIRGIPAQVTIALAAAARAPSIFITRLVTAFNKWRGVNPSYDDMLVSIREAVENGVDNAKAGKLIEGGYINPVYLDAVRAQAENLALHGLDVNPGEIGTAVANFIRQVDPSLAPNLASVIMEQVREAVEDGLSRGLSLRSLLVDLSGIKDVKQLDSYFQDSLTRYLSNYLGEKNARFIVGKIMDAVKNGNEKDALLLLEQTLRPGVGEYGQWLREFRDALLSGDFSRALELLQYPVARQPFEQVYAIYQGTATNLPPSWEVNVVEDYIDEYFNARKSLLEGVRPPTAGVKPQAQPTSQVFQASSDVKQATNDLYQRLNQVLANAPDAVRNAIAPILEQLRSVQSAGDLDLLVSQLIETLGQLTVTSPDALQAVAAASLVLREFMNANRDLLLPMTPTAAADILSSIAAKAPDNLKQAFNAAVEALRSGNVNALNDLVNTLRDAAKTDPTVAPLLDTVTELQQRLVPPPSTPGLTETGAAAAGQQPPVTQPQAPQAPQVQPQLPPTTGGGVQALLEPRQAANDIFNTLSQLTSKLSTGARSVVEPIIEQLKTASTLADITLLLRQLYVTVTDIHPSKEYNALINVIRNIEQSLYPTTPTDAAKLISELAGKAPDALRSQLNTVAEELNRGVVSALGSLVEELRNQVKVNPQLAPLAGVLDNEWRVLMRGFARRVSELFNLVNQAPAQVRQELTQWLTTLNNALSNGYNGAPIAAHIIHDIDDALQANPGNTTLAELRNGLLEVYRALTGSERLPPPPPRVEEAQPTAPQFTSPYEELGHNVGAVTSELKDVRNANVRGQLIQLLMDFRNAVENNNAEQAAEVFSKLRDAVNNAVKTDPEDAPTLQRMLEQLTELYNTYTALQHGAPPPTVQPQVTQQQPPSTTQGQAQPPSTATATTTPPSGGMMVSGGGGAALEVLPQAPQPNVDALLKQLPQLNQSPDTVARLRNIFSTSADVLYITNRLSEEREIVNVFKSLGITPNVFINALEKAGYPVPDAIKDAAASSNTWEEFFEKIRNILPERQPEEYYTRETQKPGWAGATGPRPPTLERPGEIEVGVPLTPGGAAREMPGVTGEYAAAPGAPTAVAPYTVGRFPGMPTIELMPLVVGIPPIPIIYAPPLTQQYYEQATTTTTTGPPAEMPQQPPELVGPGVVPTPTGFLWPITQAGAGQRPGRKTRGVYEVLTI